LIERLVIFGATGDLTARYLLPGIVALRAAGRLPEKFRLTGAGREDWDTDRYRGWAVEQLDRHAREFPTDTKDAVVSATAYQQCDVTQPQSVAAAVAGEGPVAAYLALPPVVFPAAVTALGAAQLPEGSRVVLEKPSSASITSWP
jgi:glucose-6-phosphate 1-dehydrogenase